MSDDGEKGETSPSNELTDDEKEAVVQAASFAYTQATGQFIQELKQCLDDKNVLTVFGSGFISVLLAEFGQERGEYFLRRTLSRLENGDYRPRTVQ